MPELLEIWKSVKQGIKPDDTRHSFCIPRQWIETLDPRVKERIRKEARERLIEKDKPKRAKFVEKLEQYLKKEKISKDLYDEKLSQYDELFEVQVQNTIAKEIEKVHTYHFNLQNYRSSLTDEQIKKWQEVLKIPTPLAGEGQGEGESFDERYNQLTNNPSPDNALKIISTFDPRNAIEMDIAREYLRKLSQKVLNTNKPLEMLNNILKSGHQFPKVEFRRLITLQNGFIEIEDDKEYKLITCKLHGQGVVFRESIFGSNIKTKKQQVVKANQLLVAEIDAKNGGYGVIPVECDGAIVSSHYYVYFINQNKLLPDYLSLVLTNQNIEEQVSAYVRGATSYAAIRPNIF